MLNTETGKVRYRATAGGGLVTGQTVQPFPLGEMGTAETSVVDQLNRPPADAGASPFPYAEPVPRDQ